MENAKWRKEVDAKLDLILSVFRPADLGAESQSLLEDGIPMFEKPKV